jgi:hypothetical protein
MQLAEPPPKNEKLQACRDNLRANCAKRAISGNQYPVRRDIRQRHEEQRAEHMRLLVQRLEHK